MRRSCMRNHQTTMVMKGFVKQTPRTPPSPIPLGSTSHIHINKKQNQIKTRCLAQENSWRNPRNIGMICLIDLGISQDLFTGATMVCCTPYFLVWCLSRGEPVVGIIPILGRSFGHCPFNVLCLDASCRLLTHVVLMVGAILNPRRAYVCGPELRAHARALERARSRTRTVARHVVAPAGQRRW